MTDPNQPADPSSTPPPPAPAPQQPYAAAPPPAYAPPAEQTVPGKTLGIVAFVLSFFMQLIALILGIVALVQSRKAGQKNGFALAAIVISAVLIVIGIIVVIVWVAVLIPAGMAALCDGVPPGVYELEGGGTITCG